MGLRIAAGIAFLVTGLLEVLFCGLSVVGTGLGGVMTVGSVIGELRHEEALIGPVILLFYGLWLFATRARSTSWSACGCSCAPRAEAWCGRPPSRRSFPW